MQLNQSSPTNDAPFFSLQPHLWVDRARFFPNDEEFEPCRGCEPTEGGMCHHLEAGPSSRSRGSLADGAANHMDTSDTDHTSYPDVLPKVVFAPQPSRRHNDTVLSRPGARFVFVAGLEGSGHHFMAQVFKSCATEAAPQVLRKFLFLHTNKPAASFATCSCFKCSQ